MKKIFLGFLCFFILIGARPIYAFHNPQSISVKIGPSSQKVSLYSRDGFILQKANGEKESLSYDTIEIVLMEKGIISLKAGDLKRDIQEKDRIHPIAETFKFNKIQYRGDFFPIIQNDKLSIINNLLIEDYLQGVVAKEIGSTANIEALKAQAVVSRSFAYANYNKYQSLGYNLDDTVSSQVYSGYSAETDSTNQAVKLTKGQVLMFQDAIANTIFHATSGGVTEAIEDVWGGERVAYLPSINDPYSINTVNSKWELHLSSEDLNSKYQSQIGPIQSLEILSRSKSGRVKEIRLVGSKGSKTVSGNDFRMKIGSTKLKSTNFYFSDLSSTNDSMERETILTKDGKKLMGEWENVLSKKGKTSLQMIGRKKLRADGIYPLGNSTIKETIDVGKGILINGKGYGHGVGMSQYGAINMAKEGKDYREILYFYFPGTNILDR